MKYSWLLLVIALSIFLVACSSSYSFEDGYHAMRKIDNKYGVNFHKERLNGSMISLSLMNDVFKDLDALEVKVKAKPQSNETKDVLDLLAARRLMIESQRYWLLAKEIGPSGLTRSAGLHSSIRPDFSCNDIPKVRDTTLYLLKSWDAATKAEKILDELLARNLVARDLIGTNAQKPEFYRSPLDAVSTDIQYNIQDSFQQCQVKL